MSNRATSHLGDFSDDPSTAEAEFDVAAAGAASGVTEQVFEQVGAQMLVGILALQHNFVDRDAILAAFEVWIGDKSRGLGKILVDSGALTAVRLALLETLASQVLREYGGDLNKCLASRDLLGTIRDDLTRLDDTDIDATLTGLPADATTKSYHQPAPGDGNGAASMCFPDNRFRLIEKINGGGQGDIYLAMDEALNRKVVLKRIKKRYADIAEFQARLLVEAEVAARLEHPAFLPVHFAGFDAEGRPYFVMRYVEGDSNFRSKIEVFHSAGCAARSPDERRQELRKLLRHFVDVCYAVAYAHERGVIHRDIKPANVLVGQFGETYLVDWGMVKFAGRSANSEARGDEPLLPSSCRSPVFTVEGGTVPYMSPEQVARRTVSFASDVYSLGATLYTLLTGKPAFAAEGKDRAVVAGDIAHGRFKPPREADSRVPPALEAVCLKAMKVCPEERYSAAKEIARDLEDWLANRPIAVYPEPLLLRARRWARNHRPAVAGLGVLLVTSLLYFIVTDVTVRHERARTERNYVLARDTLLRLVRLARIPPKSKETRDELAKTAIESTRSFLRSRPQDRGVRLDAARTYRAIANIGRAVGEFEEPKRLYQEGGDLLGLLHREFPNDPAIAEEQALNSLDAGELWLMNGQPAAAQVIFESVFQKLDKSGGKSTGVLQHVKALALVKLATALNEMDGSRRARESAIRAVELLTALRNGAIHQPEEALWLLLAHTQVGLAEVLLENPGGSEEWFTQAIGQGEALIQSGHDTPEVKQALACSMRYRAESSSPDRNLPAKSLEDFSQASLLLNSLAEEHPHVLHYHRDMAICYIGWVDMLLARQNVGDLTVKLNADAEKELGAYAGSRELFDYHRYLGRILAQRARIAKAQSDFMRARSFFDRAVDEHNKALHANRQSRIDRLLEERLAQERAALP
jgi:serine/threonine protein kinase